MSSKVTYSYDRQDIIDGVIDHNNDKNRKGPKIDLAEAARPTNNDWRNAALYDEYDLSMEDLAREELNNV